MVFDKERIFEFAKASYPNEACGLVVQIGKKAHIRMCKNIAELPDRDFVIDPIDYCSISSEGRIVGVWHSHVDRPETPSEADKFGCEISGINWYIVSVYSDGSSLVAGGMAVLTPSGEPIDYVGRPYIPGILDCYTLLRDYYRREYDIHLNDYPRVERFWERGLNPLGEGWEKNGFVQVIAEEPKAGDVFLCQTSGCVPNHIMIFIGDEMILHHCTGRLSGRDIYGGFWRKHTVLHLRHKNLC